MARRFRAVAAVAAAAILLSPASGSAQERVSIDEYLARLVGAGRMAESLVAPTPERMEHLRGTLGLPLVVELSGNQIVLPADPLLERLTGQHAADFERAAARLDLLERAARSARDAPSLDSERIGNALRGAYVGVRASPNLIERIRRALGAIGGELFVRLLNFRGGGSILAWGVVAAALIGIFLLLRRMSVVPERAERVARRLEATRVDWGRLAEEAMSRGDLAEAVRARYRALLAALVARGVVADEPSLTAGECRLAVRSSLPALYPTVERATEIFELAAYARAPLAREDVDFVQDAERAVIAA